MISRGSARDRARRVESRRRSRAGRCGTPGDDRGTRRARRGSRIARGRAGSAALLTRRLNWNVGSQKERWAHPGRGGDLTRTLTMPEPLSHTRAETSPSSAMLIFCGDGTGRLSAARSECRALAGHLRVVGEKKKTTRPGWHTAAFLKRRSARKTARDASGEARADALRTVSGSSRTFVVVPRKLRVVERSRSLGGWSDARRRRDVHHFLLQLAVDDRDEVAVCELQRLARVARSWRDRSFHP